MSYKTELKYADVRDQRHLASLVKCKNGGSYADYRR